jgi:cobalamin biosynthesis Mg chelatase CobN
MHWALRPTRLLFAALPLLALAALLLAPSAAFACEGTSGEITYCPHVPEIKTESPKHEKSPTKHHHAKPPTHHSTSPKSEEPTETTEPETEPHSGEGHHSKVAPAGKGGNHPGGGKPGSQASSKPQSDHISSAKVVTPKTSGGPTTKGVPASASTGGSSPVLPILVAIVVLAAISIGVVVYRERKGGDGQAGYTGARG